MVDSGSVKLNLLRNRHRNDRLKLFCVTLLIRDIFLSFLKEVFCIFFHIYSHLILRENF